MKETLRNLWSVIAMSKFSFNAALVMSINFTSEDLNLIASHLVSDAALIIGMFKVQVVELPILVVDVIDKVIKQL